MKKFLENFLELQKHPSCIILSVIGWCDIITWIIAFLCVITNSAFLFWLFLAYIGVFRIPLFFYYIVPILALFIAEKKFNFVFKGQSFNSKIYKVVWKIGIVGFILGTITLPLAMVFIGLSF